MILKKANAAERLPYDTEPVPEQGIDLVAVFVAILAEWRVALITFLLAAAIGLAYVYSLKPQYIAAATILPTMGHTEAASVASIFEASGSGNLYMGLLRSRSVQDDVIDHAHLRQLWGVQSYEVARMILFSRSFFGQGSDAIMTIAVRDENAENAAMIANAYLVALQDLNDKMAQTQAAQSQKFYDRLLQQQRDQLEEAEQDLMKLQIRTGQVASGTQAAVGVGNIEGYQAQIKGLEVQLAVMKQSETEENPDVKRVRSQIAQLEAEIREQERGTARLPVGAATPSAQIPAVNLELSHAEAVVAARRAGVAAVAGQLGAAHMDAQLSHPAFQIIDRATAPEFRAWPPRQQYINAALGFAALAAFSVVLIWLVIKRILANPTHRASLVRLRRAF